MTLIPFIFIWVSYLPILAHKLLHESLLASPKKSDNIIQNAAVLSFFTQEDQPYRWFQLIFDVIALISMIICYAQHNFTPSWQLFFISAMLLVIYTDTKNLLISNFTTTYLIPFGILLSIFGITNTSLTSSIAGTLIGFLLLYIPNFIFKKIYSHDGIGSGDFDLLACIGSFTGLLGAWVSLSIGAISGTILTGLYQVITKQSTQKFPFGAFIASGAIIFTLYPKIFVNFFLS